MRTLQFTVCKLLAVSNPPESTEKVTFFFCLIEQGGSRRAPSGGARRQRQEGRTPIAPGSSPAGPLWVGPQTAALRGSALVSCGVPPRNTPWHLLRPFLQQPRCWFLHSPPASQGQKAGLYSGGEGSKMFRRSLEGLFDTWVWGRP